ncbi:MAG TPA: hypothetical protein VID68_09625 [Solirubrobacteraceae bacterium]|jgi:hypothetical protein
MPRSTADIFRGGLTTIVVGVVSVLVPPASLPPHFGYYAVAAAFLLGMRFGPRAIAMFFIGCVAVGLANLAGRGACVPSSDHVRCGFEAAEPLLVFGYFVGPTLAGVLVGAAIRVSRAVRSQAGVSPAVLPPGRERLLIGHTLTVALAAATAAFLALALLSPGGGSLLLPALGACVAFGLAPTYAGETPERSAHTSAPSW